MPARTPEEIRASIEENREQLGVSLEKLRVEVAVLTDWRARARRSERELSLGAAAAGFVIGGGVAGLGSLLFGGKRRRARRRALR
ncbi:MAG: DUF3618 domain-containing protein [Solirubrobacteraceae bacterium]|jgi:hypothetical protein